MTTKTKALLRLDESHALAHGAVSSIRFWRHLLLVGTAAPRHNKIHVYYYGNNNKNPDDSNRRHCYYAGSLTGHENWITSLAMSNSSGNNNNNNHILASASQDARIRLWKFQSRVAAGNNTTPAKKDSAVVVEESAENIDDTTMMTMMYYSTKTSNRTRKESRDWKLLTKRKIRFFPSRWRRSYTVTRRVSPR